jgi:hypothetical protein
MTRLQDQKRIPLFLKLKTRHSTVRKKEPAHKEQDDDNGLAQGYFGDRSGIQDISPILRRKDLIDGQERREDLSKVHRQATLHIAPQDLRHKKCSEIIDDHKKKYHVHQSAHVRKHGQQQRLHTWYLQNDTIESRQLEYRQPRVSLRVVYDWNLDDGRSDGEHKVQVIMSLYEEPSPVRQVSDETHYDLNVERDGDDQLANVENLRVHRADVHFPRRLEDERGKSECYPTPPDTLIYFPHNIPSRFTATRIGPGGLVLLVNDGLDAIKQG